MQRQWMWGKAQWPLLWVAIAIGSLGLSSPATANSKAEPLAHEPLAQDLGLPVAQEAVAQEAVAQEAVAQEAVAQEAVAQEEPVTPAANTLALEPLPAVVSAPLTPASLLESVIAERNGDTIGQVTSVTQLADVRPSDWAFQALQSLVERYGCLQGYPDKTFRGNRSLTRYEFAAGLNACIDRVNELIANATDPMATKEDMAVMQRLQEEFRSELATLRGRVDGLEAKITELEAQQFSTTTKLSGQLVMGIQGRFNNKADFFPVDGRRDTDDPGTNTNLISNLQLNLLTQFGPKSLLLTGLQVGSGSTAPRLTNDSRLSYEGPTDNQLLLSDLTYRQLIGNRLALIVGPKGVNPVNVFRGANRVESAGFGPISAFAQRNPIINIGAGQGGLGFDWQATNWLSLQGVYSSSSPSDAKDGGIFGGRSNDTAFGLQATMTPTQNLDVALHYVNAYSPLGRLRTGIGDDQLSSGSALKTNAFGSTVSWRVSPRFTLGGWGGVTLSDRVGGSGSVTTTNWMAFMNFPDLFKQGNLGGIYIGQPPKIVSSDLPRGENIPDLLAGGLGNSGGQPGTTTHVELFYRHRLTNNIAITPGLLMIFHPGNTPNSDPITIGSLRTTLTF
jgi:hypothetical protein